MKKISVIIPVYNAMTSGGGYINRCVDSVLLQKDFSMDEVEILLINDGSKDNSLEVLRSIEKMHEKIVRVIDQKNIGVAKTRNKAILRATGEYVVFIDQDDWIDKDYFNTLYSAAIRNRSDVVISGYRRPNAKGGTVRAFQPKNSSYGRYTLSASWAKIHRTEFLRQNKISFFDNSYGEDTPFMVKENVTTKEYCIIKYIGYNWFLNEQSVSNTSQKGLAPKTIIAIENLFRKLTKLEVKNNHRDYHYFLLRTVVYSLLFSGRVADKKDFMKAKQRFFTILENLDDIFLSKNIHKLIRSPKGEMFAVSVVVTVFVALYKFGLLSLFASVWCKQPKSS